MSGVGASNETWNLDLQWPQSGTSKVYDLAQPLRPGVPHHPMHPPFAFVLTKLHGDVEYENGVTASSEMFASGGHVGTHVDALSHIAQHGKIHGNVDVMKNQSYTGGMAQHGVETLQPMVNDGFLVDVPELFGRECTPTDVITDTDFEKWFDGRPKPGPGSIVLVRTGWDSHWGDARTFLGVSTGLPGVDEKGAKWLSERGIAVTGSDTVSYEPIPTHHFPVHVHLLKEKGIPILEVLNMVALSADKVYEFSFVAMPLRLSGATGSPLRPLAVVPGE